MNGGDSSQTALTVLQDLAPASLVLEPPSVQIRTTFIPVLPLTPDAFEPFGQVIQAYAEKDAAPRSIRITPANEGTASKFHKLALLSSSYPPETKATTGLSVYRCQPVQNPATDGTWQITTLERHPFTNQAFIPMGCSMMADNGLENSGTSYLVVVAKNGVDDKPDPGTLRAFIASAAQGIMYDKAVWRG
jgi:allantoicase